MSRRGFARGGRDTRLGGGKPLSRAVGGRGGVRLGPRQHGQIGRGEAPSEPAPDALVPARVSALVDANITCAQIACGGDHALALTTRGVVLAWGRGSSGPAGRGETEDVRTPTRVDPALFRGERVVHVSAGRAHNVAVGESGTVYTWGDGSRGQLAHRDESGTVYTWGDGSRGQLDGTREDGTREDGTRSQTVSGVAPVAGLPRGRDVRFAVAAGDHTVAVLGPAPVRASAARGAARVGFKSSTAIRGVSNRRRRLATRPTTLPTTLPPLLELAERVAEARVGAVDERRARDVELTELTFAELEHRGRE